jgi:hypothetical protein
VLCTLSSRGQIDCASQAVSREWLFPAFSKRFDAWWLTSLQERLVKTGGRLIKHARYYWLMLAEGHLHRRLFGQMLQRIWALPAPNG